MSIAQRQLSKETPFSRREIVKLYTLFNTQDPKNHTLFYGTYLEIRPNAELVNGFDEFRTLRGINTNFFPSHNLSLGLVRSQ